jgi:hypothetical protein
MVAKITGGELKLGSDPELAPDKQVLREVRFMNKKEIDSLENIYPKFFNDEIWQVLSDDLNGMTYYKLRYQD